MLQKRSPIATKTPPPTMTSPPNTGQFHDLPLVDPRPFFKHVQFAPFRCRGNISRNDTSQPREWHFSVAEISGGKWNLFWISYKWIYVNNITFYYMVYHLDHDRPSRFLSVSSGKHYDFYVGMLVSASTLTYLYNIQFSFFFCISTRFLINIRTL